jgi:hypothetical protein
MIANAMDRLFAASPEKLGEMRAAARERTRRKTGAFRRRIVAHAVQKGDDGSPR